MTTMEATKVSRRESKAAQSGHPDREKLLGILRRNQSLFMNRDSSFSPDRFDALKLLLLRDFDADCFNVVSQEFLCQLHAAGRSR